MLKALSKFIPPSLRSKIRGIYIEQKSKAIYRRFMTHTMIDPRSYCDNLNLARRVKSIPGCVVECGVWKGGMSAGIATVLGPDRTYYLYDSFEGLPQASEIDGPGAIEWQSNKEAPIYYDNCTAGEAFAREVMTAAGVPRFHLIKGWFKDSLPESKPKEPIALLRLDGDWYDSTMQCLDNLFDQVSPGGLILIDDYYAWDGCSRAVHDFLSKKSAVERIQSLNHVCYIVRRN